MLTRRSLLSTIPAAAVAARSLPTHARGQTPTHAAWLAPYLEDVRRLIEAGTGSTFAWDRLAELCDTFGSRLTGSRNLELATTWAVEAMRNDGLKQVRLQKTKGPQWVRGDESLEHLVAPVLVHEVGPHFGLSDEAMHALEDAAPD